MKRYPHASSETSIIGQALALAHATFYDALPANMKRKGPTAPASLPSKQAPLRDTLLRWTESIDSWFYRQRVKDREAYLAQATDIHDVERRMRELERRPFY